MAIGIDISVLGITLEGIGYYTLRLLQKLPSVEDAPCLKFFSYGRRRPPLESLGLREEDYRHWGVPGKMACLLWRGLKWPEVQRFIGQVELFHATNHLVPPVRDVPYVLTLYDLFFLKKDKRDCTWEERRYREALSGAVSSASRIICLSDFVASEAKERWDLAEDLVDIIPGGVDSFSLPESVEIVQSTLHRLGVYTPYVLHVGYQGIRKNLSLLVEGFVRLAQEGVHLVLAGREGPSTPELRLQCEERGISHCVHFLGYVGRKDLACLYAGADCFVFPSLEEGFGLPVLEAMSAGVPVVTSRSGSLPEVTGDAGILVNSSDAEELYQAVHKVLHENLLRETLISKGKQRAAQYSWDETARKTVASYRKCLS